MSREGFRQAWKDRTMKRNERAVLMMGSRLFSQVDKAFRWVEVGGPQ